MHVKWIFVIFEAFPYPAIMSKTRNLLHIVIATYQRTPAIPESHKKELYGYLYGLLKNYKCEVLRINGMADHVHLLIDLHQSVALATLMHELKRCSSIWARSAEALHGFPGWGEGYFAVSVSPGDADAVKAYIMSQEEHHKGSGVLDELRELSLRYGINFMPRDW